MTIREYIMRHWRWFPLMLIVSIAGAVALYHWVPHVTRLGRTIAICVAVWQEIVGNDRSHDTRFDILRGGRRPLGSETLGIYLL